MFRKLSLACECSLPKFTIKVWLVRDQHDVLLAPLWPFGASEAGRGATAGLGEQVLLQAVPRKSISPFPLSKKHNIKFKRTITEKPSGCISFWNAKVYLPYQCWYVHSKFFEVGKLMTIWMFVSIKGYGKTLSSRV